MTLRITPSVILLFAASTLLAACNSGSWQEDWTLINSSKKDSFIIDPTIKVQANLLLEGQPEVQTFEDALDQGKKEKRKKSTNVTIHVIAGDTTKWNKLRCISILSHDTLDIEISINLGLGGIVAYTKYTGKKMASDIFKWNDQVTGEVEPTHLVKKQKLILDKHTYSVGDSLHGHIYLTVIVLNKVSYHAEGYFRAKVGAKY